MLVQDNSFVPIRSSTSTADDAVVTYVFSPLLKQLGEILLVGMKDEAATNEAIMIVARNMV